MNNYEVILLLLMLATCVSKNRRLLTHCWIALLFVCMLESFSHSSATRQSNPQHGPKKPRDELAEGKEVEWKRRKKGEAGRWRQR